MSIKKIEILHIPDHVEKISMSIEKERMIDIFGIKKGKIIRKNKIRVSKKSKLQIQ